MQLRRLGISSSRYLVIVLGAASLVLFYMDSLRFGEVATNATEHVLFSFRSCGGISGMYGNLVLVNS